MVEQTLRTWLTDQTINTFRVPARTQMEPTVLASWPRTPDGALDLKRAPMRLLAIVNRIDSRNLAQGHAGEGRFVFGVLGAALGPFVGFPLQVTFIFAYRLPAKTTADVQVWADRWHALAALPFPSEEYNAALQDITDDFTLRGAEPGRVNGSALAQLRTNDFALVPLWELREFELSSASNRLAPVTVKLTPDTSFQRGSALVADYVNANEASILLEQHVVPETFQGQPFLGGSSFNNLISWIAPGINNNEARHKFSLNTCNGCHASEENGTQFLHIFPRGQGQVSSLSGFMAGGATPDPVTGVPRSFNDLGRRNQDLTRLVCPETPTVTARGVASGASLREAFLAKGINRTH